MGKIVFKLPRTVTDEETGRKIIINKREKIYIKDPEKDFNNGKDKITKEELKKKGFFKKEKTEYAIIEADYIDEYLRMKRLAQIISLKDIGRIITLLGITEESTIIEAGSGSGALTSYISRIAKKIYSYDINEEHQKIARENVNKLGRKNVEFLLKDIYNPENIEKHEADGFILDVPEPEKALETAKKALRTGGRLVIYSPNLTQLREVSKKIPKEMIIEKTISLNEQEWEVTKKILRPKMQGLGHTAFLMLIRKISD